MASLKYTIITFSLVFNLNKSLTATSESFVMKANPNYTFYMNELSEKTKVSMEAPRIKFTAWKVINMKFNKIHYVFKNLRG